MPSPRSPNPASRSTQRQAQHQVSTRVLRLRIKDKHAGVLAAMARDVNLVWNFVNELSQRCWQRERRFMGSAEIQRYLNGASAEGLRVGSAVFQQVADEYVVRRRQFKRTRLRWRVSRGSRRSLGWIPFKARSLNYRAGQLRFQGHDLCLWDSYGLSGYTLRSGAFSEDARGRWYVNICVEVARPERTCGTAAVGIDLGLKDLATCSDGRKVEAQQFYRDLEPALAKAQRANQVRRTRALHAKIASRRKDFLHKLSRELVAGNAAILVGDVSSAKLARTGAAKSVLDAGWSTFKAMLQYKGDDAGCVVRVIDERHSTQDCSVCHSRGGPKGLEGLAVRRWCCTTCGTEHDRDINAARNILARGLVVLEKEFAAAAEARAREPAVNEAPAVGGAGPGHGPLAAGIPVL